MKHIRLEVIVDKDHIEELSEFKIYDLHELDRFMYKLRELIDGYDYDKTKLI